MGRLPGGTSLFHRSHQTDGSPPIDVRKKINNRSLPQATVHDENMPTFQSKKFRSAGEGNAVGAKYRAVMSKHPFLMFGLPFLAVIVAGSFVLTPATAIRYERHDRRVRQMTRDEELNVRRSARKVDMREEYYVCRWQFMGSRTRRASESRRLESIC